MFSLVSFVKKVAGTEGLPKHRRQKGVVSGCNVTPVAAAIVTRTIAPGRKGQVQFQGSWWPARCNDEMTLAVGELVRVIQRQDLTLYIEPFSTLSK
ncbi:MAG: NfeD family protein [Leptolyngbya sp. BL-A-14]